MVALNFLKFKLNKPKYLFFIVKHSECSRRLGEVQMRDKIWRCGVGIQVLRDVALGVSPRGQTSPLVVVVPHLEAVVLVGVNEPSLRVVAVFLLAAAHDEAAPVVAVELDVSQLYDSVSTIVAAGENGFVRIR